MTTISIRSRRCTAWGIAIRKPDAPDLKTPEETARRRGIATARASAAAAPFRRVRPLIFSPIARRILLANLAGLLILIVGALVLNEIRSSLINARKDSLLEASQIISNFMTDKATLEDEAKLDVGLVKRYVKRLPLTGATRIRVHDPTNTVIADTRLLKDEINEKDLPPVKEPNDFARAWLDFVRSANSTIENITQAGRPRIAEARSLPEEVEIAMRGGPVFSERFGDNAERVLSLTVPITKVAAVVGTLTVETSDVAKIIGDERAALVPLIIVAVLVAVITSTLLTLGIARPVQQLAAASDRVRTGAAERLSLGRLHDRKDELGDLAQAMEAMTRSLYDRIQENERFAADVAHELKNPLTSIRSAVETAQAVPDPAVRERMRDVIAKDVIRLDRLISDISNLTRLEGEIVREKLVRVDLARLLEDIVSIYADTGRAGEAKVTFFVESKGAMEVMGREGPLGQVIRNLVENAKSFSPPGGEVRVTLSRMVGTRTPTLRIMVEDNGPGIPPDKLEKVFERFYTDRPKGSKFGNNSGLGLSIVRQIVETHRGRVWAENKMADGEVAGARFVVELPPAPLDI